jgi:HK97 family phage portal protein
VRVLTESFAVLPFKLYRPRLGGKGRQLVTDHWAYSLFTRRPNRFLNPFTFREMLQGHLTLRGNAFCEIVDDDRGGVAELMPRHPDRVKIELLDNGSWRYRYTDLDGSQRIIRRDQMWHIRGLSSDGICGYNPIELAREAIGAGLSAQDYGNRFFANDAKPSGGWIEYPGKFADKAARISFAEQVRDAISGQKRHGILTLDNNMKYHEVGVSNKDSQFLESRGYTRTEIAGLFRVPPHMIADLSRATFSNIEQQSIDFWQNTMLPWTERWEAAVEELLVDEPDLDVEFDFRNLMRGDSASRGIYLHNLVLDGVLTRNEARGWEGLDPIEGLDTPLVPTNERELGDADPHGEAGPGEQLPDAVQPPADDDSTEARLAQVLRGNAARMARRITAGDPPETDVLAAALAIPPSVGEVALRVLSEGQQPVNAVTDFLLSVALKGKP